MATLYVMSVEETRVWEGGGPAREAIKDKAYYLGALEIVTCQGKRVWNLAGPENEAAR
jgi:hypothetical protein